MGGEKRFSFPWKSTIANFIFAVVVFVTGIWFGGKDPVSMGGVSGWCFVAIQMFLIHRQRNTDMAALNEQFGGALSNIYVQLEDYKSILDRLKELSDRFVRDNARYVMFAPINEETESVFTIGETKIYEIYNATWNIEMFDSSELGEYMNKEHRTRLQTADEINYYVLYEKQYYADADAKQPEQQLYISVRDMECFLTDFISKITDAEEKRWTEETLKKKWRVTLLPPDTKLDKAVSFIIARDEYRRTKTVRLFVNSPIFMDNRNAHKEVFAEFNAERFGSYDGYLSKRKQTCTQRGQKKVGCVRIDNGKVTIDFTESSERPLPPAAQPTLPPASSGHSPSPGAVAGGQSRESAEKAPI